MNASVSEFEQAALEAGNAIHDNNSTYLKELLREHPALLSWRDPIGRTLLQATTAFALDTPGAAQEEIYNRPECAAVLIDAGMAVEPSVWSKVIESRAAGMLRLLWSKGTLPHTLPVLAAIGDLTLVKSAFDTPQSLLLSAQPGNTDEQATIHEALINACGFGHTSVATFLLERAIALDATLGSRIDAWGSRAAFVEYLSTHPLSLVNHSSMNPVLTPWLSFAMRSLFAAIDQDDHPAFTSWLKSDPYLLEPPYAGLQVELIEHASWNNRGPMIASMLDLDPSILHLAPPPRSFSLIYAMDYGNAHLLPMLTRIWPLPDDLPHAAGAGNLEAVKRWFDQNGQAALGDLDRHYPNNNPEVRANLHLRATGAQPVLDCALAWACMNRRLPIAAYLLDHGADINTRWGTHEPASILHECAVQDNQEAARFLVDRGINLDMEDYRYHATAAGWARYAAGNEALAELLTAAKQEQDKRKDSR